MAVKRLTSTSSVFRRFGSCEIAASSVGLCVGIVVDCWCKCLDVSNLMSELFSVGEMVGVVGVVGVVGFSTPSSTFVCARLPLRFRRDSFASNLATAPLTGGMLSPPRLMPCFFSAPFFSLHFLFFLSVQLPVECAPRLWPAIFTVFAFFFCEPYSNNRINITVYPVLYSQYAKREYKAFLLYKMD
ncbi:hypothetical protein F5X97DRAFT_299721 [Nemania serpens]|nr:hypothetical protein F5X97DRAFT_299721 [Nemania serpens]